MTIWEWLGLAAIIIVVAWAENEMAKSKPKIKTESNWEDK